MFITGPDVVKTVTGEEVTLEQLGGALTHATKSGVATFVTADEKSCLDEVRYLLGFLPVQQHGGAAPRRHRRRPRAPGPRGRRADPAQPQPALRHEEGHRRGRRRRRVLRVPRPVGHEPGVRLRPHRRPRRRHRRQPAAGPGRRARHRELGERAPASSAPATLSTSPWSRSSTSPGSCPAPTRSTAASSATGPSCSTPTARRPCPASRSSPARPTAGAYVVMNSKSIGADLAFAWPSAELAVMGPQGAVDIVYRRELADLARPRRPPGPAGRGVHRALRQPLPGGRAGLRRRRHRPRRDPQGAGPQPRPAAVQARGAPQAQARQRPAVSRDSARAQPRGAGRHHGRRRDGLAPPGRSPLPEPPAGLQPLAILRSLVVSAADGPPRAPLAAAAFLGSGKDGAPRAGDRRRRRGRGVRRAGSPFAMRACNPGPNSAPGRSPSGLCADRPGSGWRRSPPSTTCISARPACGVIAGLDLGPVLHAESGRPPYPLVMNQAAVAEIKVISPDAVVAKGDLTSSGTLEQFEQFLRRYGSAFGTASPTPAATTTIRGGRLRPRRRGGATRRDPGGPRHLPARAGGRRRGRRPGRLARRTWRPGGPAR